MIPTEKYQQTILKQHVRTDDATHSRYPTLEAALVSKYAALASPYRSRDRKEQDAVDFRKIVRANPNSFVAMCLPNWPNRSGRVAERT